MFQFGDSGREELKRALKFAVTGVGNTVVDFVVFTVLAVWLGANVPFSQFCGYSAGMLNSYLINRSWTFHSAQRFFSGQLLRFVFSNLVTLGLSMLLIGAFARMGLADLFAMLLSTCVTLAVNFLFSRLWVFR